MILSHTDFISATAPAQPREADSHLPFRIVANNLWKSVLKYHRQHDLKGRMPERSEWLLAEGCADA